MNGLRLALIVPLLALGAGCSSGGGGGGAGGAAGEGGTSTGGSSGGASSGGSKTGGTGTGGSGGSGTSTGGKSTGGGSTGGGSTGGGVCAPFCSKLMQINCPNDPASGCAAGCEAAIDTAADEGCGPEFEDIFACWGALPASEWSCNADGQAEPSMTSCDPEFMAFLECSTN